MVPQDAWPPPVPARRAATPRGSRAARRDPEPEPPTVLLAEDDGLVRAVASRVLAQDGFIVLVACDGQEALAVAACHPEIGLLVSDMRMPGMSGLELARALRNARPGLPVLLMSGYTEESASAVAAADEFLVKPFPPSELVAAARRAIERDRPGPAGEDTPRAAG